MKSGRQRRDEIIARRRQRSADDPDGALKPWLMSASTGSESGAVPRGALLADPAKLLHSGTLSGRPRLYRDTTFVCVDCGVEEVWTAVQQKWWYEEAKGQLDTVAKRCRDCRRAERLRRLLVRRRQIEGLIAKYGLESAARRMGISRATLEQRQARWQADKPPIQP